MTTITRIVWVAAATLVAAFFAVKLLSTHDAEMAPKVAAESNLFPFVRSLQGTLPDGDVKASADDVLIINSNLPKLFDYYLSAYGEKSLDAIRAEIEHELDQHLRPKAANEAKRILARYLDYKRALLELDKNPKTVGGSLDAVRTRLNAGHELRAQFFSAKEVQGMFGNDDNRDADAMARIVITQNKSLSAEQKQEKLAALDAKLPPAVLEAREAPLKVAKQEALAEKMRSQGASEDDIYRMRAAAFSPEAAARLAEVDQEQTAWKNRIAAYLADRNKLISDNTNLPVANSQAALQQLREGRFTSNEQKRLAAYE